MHFGFSTLWTIIGSGKRGCSTEVARGEVLQGCGGASLTRFRQNNWVKISLFQEKCFTLQREIEF